MRSIIITLMIGLGLACTAAFAAPPTTCQELWSGTCVGMTVEDVLKTVSNSIRVPPQPGMRLADGADELADGPPLTIANEHFVPRFYFSDGRLEQVTLGLDEVSTLHSPALTFEELVSALRAKYGTEVSENRPAVPSPFYLHTMTWLHERMKITMYCVVGLGTPVLNIVYQHRVAADASHL